MQYEYFLASRFRNKDIVLDLLAKMREKGKKVYCFLETDASKNHVGDLNCNPEEAMAKFEAVQDWRTDPDVREVFDTDMNALRDSEKLVLLLPAGKSSHMEAGAAYGMGKECIVVGEQKETETLYLIFNKHFDSADAFIKSL